VHAPLSAACNAGDISGGICSNPLVTGLTIGQYCSILSSCPGAAGIKIPLAPPPMVAPMLPGLAAQICSQIPTSDLQDWLATCSAPAVRSWPCRYKVTLLLTLVAGGEKQEAGHHADLFEIDKIFSNRVQWMGKRESSDHSQQGYLWQPRQAIMLCVLGCFQEEYNVCLKPTQLAACNY
jgi:hypothetical protein